MADATINILSRDSYSNDVSITKWVIDSDGQGFEENLHVQLKTVYSKSNYRYNNNGDIVYDFKVKNY